MGLGKIILGIFGVILLLIIIIGVDGYLTFTTFNDLSQSDIDNMVSNPTFTVSGANSEIITIAIEVDLPDAGFIPKGVVIKLVVDFAGDVQSTEDIVDLGNSKTLSLQFIMTNANAQTLAGGGSITVTAKAEITPSMFNYPIDAAKQDIDLASHTVTS